MVLLLFLGLFQGVTEFLPVSSSGHLFILGYFFLKGHSILSLIVFLHLATLLAILLFFGKDCLKLLTNHTLIMHICLVSAISAFIGIVVKLWIIKYFVYPLIVACLFLINGIILLSTRKYQGQKTQQNLTMKDSILLGILQGCAVCPGISRSGITISGLLHRGFTPNEAFRLSFLMGIPVILGAFALEAKDLLATSFTTTQLAVSFTTAFISGITALWLLKKIVHRHHFYKFGYYTLGLSLGIAFLS